MAAKRKNRPGERIAGPVTRRDILKTAGHAKALLSMMDGREDELEELGINLGDVDELERVVNDLEKEVEVPSMRNVAMAALGSTFRKETILTLYHKAVQSVHSLAPFVVLKLAEKMDDHQAPGSTRVILDVAKGIGLLTTAEPMKAKNRMDMVTEGALSKASSEDLKNELLGDT